jgi:hypothetical protein
MRDALKRGNRLDCPHLCALTQPLPDPSLDVSPWKISNWHTTSTAAETALNKLQIENSLRTMPLPLFVRSSRGTRDDCRYREIDDWRLVRPEKYAETLSGSLVAITFNLYHFDIGKKDIFSARIAHIRKLRDIEGEVQVGDSPIKKRKNVLDMLTDSPDRFNGKRIKDEFF